MCTAHGLRAPVHLLAWAAARAGVEVSLGV